MTSIRNGVRASVQVDSRKSDTLYSLWQCGVVVVSEALSKHSVFESEPVHRNIFSTKIPVMGDSSTNSVPKKWILNAFTMSTPGHLASGTF